MRLRLIFPILLLAIVSCNEPERGTLDPETMSKKLFDAMKSNSPEKIALLLPDKGTFRKIEEENGHILVNLEAGYNGFEKQSSAHLDTVRNKVSNWSSATFTRGNYTESKLGKLPKARVTTKFDADGSPRKVEFTAVKFNNRWYYYGDMTWIDKIVE